MLPEDMFLGIKPTMNQCREAFLITSFTQAVLPPREWIQQQVRRALNATHVEELPSMLTSDLFNTYQRELQVIMDRDRGGQK